MDIDNKIDHNQYGNRSGVSTTHYLLKLMDTLHMNADKPGYLSNVVITDFSKAFDLVDHNVLIEKVHQYGGQTICHYVDFQLSEWKGAMCSLPRKFQ